MQNKLRNSSLWDTILPLKPAEKQILDYILKSEKKVTRTELLNASNIKIATLHRVINRLIENRLIESDEKHPIDFGRPSGLLSITSSTYYNIGVSIFRDHYSVALITLSGRILLQESISFNGHEAPADIVDSTFKIYQNFMQECNIQEESICGVGLAVIGPLDIAQGKILNPYLFKNPQWKNIPIRQVFENKFNRAVFIEYLVKAGALGAYWSGFGSKYNNLCYVTIFNGIGLGAIAHGNLLRGNNVVDGLGHMVINIQGQKCNCGKSGCLESYASIPALTDRLKSKLRDGETSIFFSKPQDVTFEALMEAVENKDPLSEKVLEEGAFYMATALSNLFEVMEMDALLIGGKFIESSSFFYNRVIEYCKKLSRPNNKLPHIIRIFNEEEEILRGAGFLIFENAINNLV